MDEKLVFNLLIAARGYRATIQSVDPENGDFSVSLKKQAAIKDLPDNRKATGIVVDEKGEPVFGAQVYITGAKQGDRKWWGQVRNIDKVAITDKDGKFVLTSDADFEQWQFSGLCSWVCQIQFRSLADRRSQSQIQIGSWLHRYRNSKEKRKTCCGIANWNVPEGSFGYQLGWRKNHLHLSLIHI